jgi:hypothetical protein
MAKSGGAVNDSLSVSTWRRNSGDTPLQATLVIVNALGSDTRRDLTITVSQEAIAGTGFPGAPPSPGTIPPPPLVSPPTIAVALSNSSKANVKKPKVSSKKK